MKLRFALLLGMTAALAAVLYFSSVRVPPRNPVDSVGDASNGAGPGAPDAAAERGKVGESHGTFDRGAVGTARGEVFGASGPVALESIPDGGFKIEILKLDRAVREEALRELANYMVPFNDLASLHVDSAGHLFYACSLGNDMNRGTQGPVAAAKAGSGDANSPAGTSTR